MRWWFPLWIVAILGGFGLLWSYGASEGPRGTLVPESSVPSELGSRVVVAAHPHCPCTLATFTEIERAVARARVSGDDITVLFFVPVGADESWAHGSLWNRAGRAGWRRRLDPDSRLAAELGLETSGHTVFYDEDGALRFSGGVTASRGHEGANTGSVTLGDLLRRSPNSRPDASVEPKCVVTPVFGCPLTDRSTSPATRSEALR